MYDKKGIKNNKTVNDTNSNSYVSSNNCCESKRIKSKWLLKFILLLQHLVIVSITATIVVANHVSASDVSREFAVTEAASALPVISHNVQNDEIFANNALVSRMHNHRHHSHHRHEQAEPEKPAVDYLRWTTTGVTDGAKNDSVVDIARGVTNADLRYKDDNFDEIFTDYFNVFNIQEEAAIPEDIIDQRHIEDEAKEEEGVKEEEGEEREKSGEERNEDFVGNGNIARTPMILKSQRNTSKKFTSNNNDDDNSNKTNNNNVKKNDNDFKSKGCNRNEQQKQQQNGKNDNKNGNLRNTYENHKCGERNTNNNNNNNNNTNNNDNNDKNSFRKHHKVYKNFNRKVNNQNNNLPSNNNNNNGNNHKSNHLKYRNTVDVIENLQQNSSSIKDGAEEYRLQQHRSQEVEEEDETPKKPDQQSHLNVVGSFVESEFHRLLPIENFYSSKNDNYYDHDDDDDDDDYNQNDNVHKTDNRNNDNYYHDNDDIISSSNNKNYKSNPTKESLENVDRRTTKEHQLKKPTTTTTTMIGDIEKVEENISTDNSDDDDEFHSDVVGFDDGIVRAAAAGGAHETLPKTTSLSHTQTTTMLETKAAATATAAGQFEKLSMDFVARKIKRHQRDERQKPQTSLDYESIKTSGREREEHPKGKQHQESQEENQQKQQSSLHSSDSSVSYLDLPVSDLLEIDRYLNRTPFNPVLDEKAIDETKLAKNYGNVTPTLSTFESAKALRRRKHRSGHKTHKKEYKDYLKHKFVTTPTTTIPGAEFLTTITESQSTSKPPNATIEKIREKNHPGKSKNFSNRHHRRLAKLELYKNNMKKSLQLPPAAAAAPIFALSRNGFSDTGRSYYEGQLSYFTETNEEGVQEDKEENDNESSAVATVSKEVISEDVGKLVTGENNNWYRRMNPILRNGRPQSATKHLQRHQHEQYPQYGQKRHYHHHLHHHHHPHHHAQDQSEQNGKQHYPTIPSKSQQQQQHQAYQRRVSNRKSPIVLPDQPQSFLLPPYPSRASSRAPLPPPSYYRPSTHEGALRELGHQITRMEEFDRYYSKWPHLARLQTRLNDEDYREARADREGIARIKPGADYDYQLMEEINEENESLGGVGNDDNDDEEDPGLPPYIKKYNRRNKQLQNLLEGTLAPSPPPPTWSPTYRQRNYSWSRSILQPGPRETSLAGIVDDYAKDKLKQYHNRNRNNKNNKDYSNKDKKKSRKAVAGGESSQQPTQQTQQQHQQNHLPDDDDVNVSSSSQEFDNWEKEMETRISGSDKTKWRMGDARKVQFQGEQTTASALPTTTTTKTEAASTGNQWSSTPPKIPRNSRVASSSSYSGFDGSNAGRPRSRSAQFLPGSNGVRRIGTTSGGNGFISALQAGNSGNYKSMPRFIAANKLFQRRRFDSAASAAAAIADTKENSSNNNYYFNDNKNNKDKIDSSTKIKSTYNRNMDDGKDEDSIQNDHYSDDSLDPITSHSSIPLHSPFSSSSISSSSLSSNSNAVASTTSTPLSVSPKPTTTSFIYHRVEAAPRIVGAGFMGGHKQRLPFVAITDRRLETSKKSPSSQEERRQRQNDFEQNHYPMP